MSESDNYLEILREALATYERLSNKAYAPINNSHKMLKKMEEYYASNIRLLSEDEIDKINVGLLAAKALDFNESFADYANKLHTVWSSFLSFLSVSYSKYPYSIPSSGPKKQAYDFYRKEGFSDKDAKDHMQGIDFAKAIDENFTLNSGDHVTQWRNQNIQQGCYYSEIGSTPTCLGIYHLQEDYQKKVQARIEHSYYLLKYVCCLKSYAADVLDTWSITNQNFSVKGGCIQYFNVRDKSKFDQISP